MKSESLRTLFLTLDPAEVLRAHFDGRKRKESKFSYQVWAVELGLKSRSFLRLVLRGERALTPEVGELFVTYFKMNKSEATYWRELIKLNQAKTLTAREQACLSLNKLRAKFALKDQSFTELDPRDVFEYFSNFKIPRLQALLAYPEIDRRPKSLSALIQSSEADVQDMLKTLTKLGLCEQEGDQFKSKTIQLNRPDMLGNVALQSFHKKSLEEAIQAIDYPKESRRFQSLLLSLSEEEMAEISSELNAKLAEILSRDEKPRLAQAIHRLYQINFNLIPVSSPFSRAANTHETPGEDTTENKNEDTL